MSVLELFNKWKEGSFLLAFPTLITKQLKYKTLIAFFVFCIKFSNWIAINYKRKAFVLTIMLILNISLSLKKEKNLCQ